MQATVADIIELMERIVPPELAEDWDNVGLQVGSVSWPVRKLWVALDPSPDVVAAAGRAGVDMLITHHPLMLAPLRNIDFSKPPGSSIDQSARHRLALYAAHTNFDSVKEGLNDILADRIGLLKIRPLAPGPDGSPGIGRIGNLEDPIELKSLATTIKKRLSLAQVKISGEASLVVNTAAVCTGSGSSLLKDFFNSKAGVYISGDMRYHDAKDIQAAGRGLIDIGHFASEHIMVEALAGRLAAEINQTEFEVDVIPYTEEKDPFVVV
jgi:dinuclear metal center YbgI/SA1388 family protein